MTTTYGVKYFTGEVGLLLVLVPYGVWRLVVRADHSLANALFIVGPILTFGFVFLTCLAIRGVVRLPGWLTNGLLKSGHLVAGFFPFVLFIKGGVDLLDLFREFSWVSLAASLFYMWLAVGPLLALDLLRRPAVRAALRELPSGE